MQFGHSEKKAREIDPGDGRTKMRSQRYPNDQSAMCASPNER